MARQTPWAVHPKKVKLWCAAAVVNPTEVAEVGFEAILALTIFTIHDPSNLTSPFLSFYLSPPNTNYAAVAPTWSLLFPVPPLGCSQYSPSQVRTLFFGALSLSTRL